MMKGYSHWFYLSLSLVLLAMLASGACLVPNWLYTMHDYGEEPYLAGSSRVKIAALHVGAAFLLCYLMGAIWVVHGRSGWRTKKHRFSGATLYIVLLVLMFTGLGNYYLGEETWRKWNSTIHVGGGMIFFVFFLFHKMQGRRVRKS